jgi:hypothetical protein
LFSIAIVSFSDRVVGRVVDVATHWSHLSLLIFMEREFGVLVIDGLLLLLRLVLTMDLLLLLLFSLTSFDLLVLVIDGHPYLDLLHLVGEGRFGMDSDQLASGVTGEHSLLEYGYIGLFGISEVQVLHSQLLEVLVRHIVSHVMDYQVEVNHGCLVVADSLEQDTLLKE